MTQNSAPGRAGSGQAMPLLPLRRGVALPGRTTTLPIGRTKSRALAATLREGDLLVLGVQRDPAVEEPSLADLHAVGTLARVEGKTDRGRRGVYLLVETLERVELETLVETSPFWRVRIGLVEETHADSEEAHALAGSLSGVLAELGNDELTKILDDDPSPPIVADRIGSLIDAPDERRVELLLERDVPTRLRTVSTMLKEARALAQLKQRVDSEVRKSLTDQQREALLRQQLRAIQKQLGEGDDRGDALREKLDAADLPEEAREVVDRELARLDAMNEQQPEAHVIRRYLELIAELPWNVRAEAAIDLDAISAILEEDHTGLDEVKRRILEHMAVLKLAPEARGTLLCLVGPPGVGKTSLAQSVARATGRPLSRVSLGGVRDEAEIRGHRRTYIGSLPGRIVNAVRKAGVKNPVLVLDEIDKLARGWAGDPEAALLEVLDPEQNATFTDHYLEIPFDLSEVLFIATANELATISPPLRDRLEVIEISGYTTDEKVRIARDHLLPKKLAEHGLGEDAVALTDDQLSLIVTDYTREAGVRQLTRVLAKLCRSVALEVARGGEETVARFDGARLRDVLGRPKFLTDAAEQTMTPGVAAGLAWTPVGGDILYIETTQMPGKGKIEITGKLGDVMQESARAALAYLRSHADELDVDASFLERHDLHIHVPAGAVPKDGPSAGVTIFTALASLLTGRQVRHDTAMTGEATLRGRVLPVGGIKSKVLAAHRAGFKRVILPFRNEPDVDDIPESIRDELEILFATDMADVLGWALQAPESTEPALPGGDAITSPASAAGWTPPRAVCSRRGSRRRRSGARRAGAPAGCRGAWSPGAWPSCPGRRCRPAAPRRCRASPRVRRAR